MFARRLEPERSTSPIEMSDKAEDASDEEGTEGELRCCIGGLSD